jgi:hypothetical protein
MRLGQRLGGFAKIGQSLRGIVSGAARIGGRIVRGVATAGAVVLGAGVGLVALNSALNYDPGVDVKAVWAEGRAMTPNLMRKNLTA